MNRQAMLDRCREKGYVVTDHDTLEHRDIYSKVHGKIPYGWVVHHIDQVKDNNDIDNLIALPEKFHSYIHEQMRDEGNRKWSRGETERELGRYLERIEAASFKIRDVDFKILKMEAELADLYKQKQVHSCNIDPLKFRQEYEVALKTAKRLKKKKKKCKKCKRPY